MLHLERQMTLPPPTLPLPGRKEEEGATTHLAVGGAAVALDALGPVVVNEVPLSISTCFLFFRSKAHQSLPNYARAIDATRAAS